MRNKTEKTDKKRVGVWSGIAAGAAGCILAAVYMGDAHTDLAVSNGEKIQGGYKNRYGNRYRNNRNRCRNDKNRLRNDRTRCGNDRNRYGQR